MQGGSELPKVLRLLLIGATPGGVFAALLLAALSVPLILLFGLSTGASSSVSFPSLPLPLAPPPRAPCGSLIAALAWSLCLHGSLRRRIVIYGDPR